MILSPLLMSFGSVAIGQELSFPIEDAQKILRVEKECDVDRRELHPRKEQEALKDQGITNLEKELDLARREIEIKDRILGLKDMEIESQKKPFENMKEVSDQAIKLAEVSKPTNNWQMQGLLGAAVFLVGFILGK